MDKKKTKTKKGQQTNQVNQQNRNLVGSDQQMQRLEEIRTVGINCYRFSNISSGTAWLLQGMFTTEKRSYNLNNQYESLCYNKKWTIDVS